jgi:hypothetical protein
LDQRGNGPLNGSSGILLPGQVGAEIRDGSPPRRPCGLIYE